MFHETGIHNACITEMLRVITYGLMYTGEQSEGLFSKAFTIFRVPCCLFFGSGTAKEQCDRRIGGWHHISCAASSRNFSGSELGRFLGSPKPWKPI